VPDTPAPDWKARYGPLVVRAAAIALTAALSALATWLGVPRDAVERLVEVPVVVGTPAGAAADFGWHPPSPDEVAAALDWTQTDQFAQTPAGKAAAGDDDVFLWQAVRKVANRGPPWYPNVNQRDVGCCVGCGWKHAADVCQAVTVARSGGALEWRPLSAEVLYAGSRNEVGGGRLAGDGSVGQWAARFATEYGAAEARAYAGVDLTEFSPARARAMGRPGQRLAPDVVAAAKANPVKGAALVRSWDDVARAVRQGYPVAVCSNVGFAGMTRDADGFARAAGSWAHCMTFIGIRGGPRPGAFCLNSWGDEAHRGPVWPADAPPAGFWVDAAVVDRMVRQADSYALSDMAGFPSRRPRPDWFIQSPTPPRDRLALRPPTPADRVRY
jgi:hypothetical protein